MQNDTDLNLAKSDCCGGHNAAILAYCDREFGSMMQDALSTSASNEVMPSMPNIADADALTHYELQLQNCADQPKIAFVPAGPTQVPSRGLGPTVFIGFDCEWEYKSEGRNKILSAQFYLIGPDGLSLPKVIHLHGRERVEERPRLADALLDLLEEAEDEGIINEWPREVVLVGFFTRADITVFSDFKNLRSQLDGVNGTFASIKGTAKLELPVTSQRAQQLKNRYQSVVGGAFDPKVLDVRLIDSSRLAPPGQPLAQLGEWLGIKKYELPPDFSKDRMSAFQRKDLVAFEQYGLRDAEIAVRYFLWVYWFSNRYLGLKGLPVTASSISVRLAEACMRRDGVEPDVALNFDTKKSYKWDAKKGRPVTEMKRVPQQIRRWLEPFISDAYVGGRNECYVFGPTASACYYDPDLAGAYVTGLGYLKALDYDKAFQTKNIDYFLGHVAGFAALKFKFPPETRFPCLPVNTESRGLIFPLEGECLCGAPEIEVALAMGAELTITFGFVIPWMDRQMVFERSRAMRSGKKSRRRVDTENITPAISPDAVNVSVSGEPESSHTAPVTDSLDDGYRLFESFAIYIRDMRAKFKRKTLPFEFVKLCGNGLYGKTGQGFKEKRVFGPKEMGSVVIGPSRVSEVVVAALVCSFIRAVLGEILSRLPPTTTVVSATTDGFLLDQGLETLDLTGPICSRFQALIDRIAPGTSMLENKHQVKQVIAMRTRGQITGEKDGDAPIVVAKAGVKPDCAAADENEFMIDLFTTRVPGQVMPRSSFISMREQLTKGWDLQMKTQDVRLNLEFDYKRKLINPKMEVIGLNGAPHISASSVPWTTADDAEFARLLFDQWRGNRCLKTLDDWNDWQAYYGVKLGNRAREREVLTVACSDSRSVTRSTTGRINITKTGYAGIAKRAFLTAFVQRQWGLASVAMSQRELADWLTSKGYPTSVNDIKNAGRSRLNPYVVPETAEVTRFLEMLQSRFAELDRGLFLMGAYAC